MQRFSAKQINTNEPEFRLNGVYRTSAPTILLSVNPNAKISELETIIIEEIKKRNTKIEELTERAKTGNIPNDPKYYTPELLRLDQLPELCLPLQKTRSSDSAITSLINNNLVYLYPIIYKDFSAKIALLDPEQAWKQKDICFNYSLEALHAHAKEYVASIATALAEGKSELSLLVNENQEYAPDKYLFYDNSSDLELIQDFRKTILEAFARNEHTPSNISDAARDYLNFLIDYKYLKELIPGSGLYGITNVHNFDDVLFHYQLQAAYLEKTALPLLKEYYLGLGQIAEAQELDNLPLADETTPTFKNYNLSRIKKLLEIIKTTTAALPINSQKKIAFCYAATQRLHQYCVEHWQALKILQEQTIEKITAPLPETETTTTQSQPEKNEEFSFGNFLQETFSLEAGVIMAISGSLASLILFTTLNITVSIIPALAFILLFSVVFSFFFKSFIVAEPAVKTKSLPHAKAGSTAITTSSVTSKELPKQSSLEKQILQKIKEYFSTPNKSQLELAFCSEDALEKLKASIKKQILTEKKANTFLTSSDKDKTLELSNAFNKATASLFLKMVIDPHQIRLPEALKNRTNPTPSVNNLYFIQNPLWGFDKHYDKLIDDYDNNYNRKAGLEKDIYNILLRKINKHYRNKGKQ